MIKLRDYQKDGLNAIWSYFNEGKTGNPVLAWPTGCHAKGTQILMFDGSIKAVEDIQIGDLLIGPDSQPREVLNLVNGNQPMFKVIPTKGEPFIINEGHIFSLKSTSDQHKRIVGLGKGQLTIINARQYLITSNWFKHTQKLWRSPVNFNYNLSDILPITPYNLGVFLGDGGYSHDSITITSQDEIILQSIIKEADFLRRFNNGSKADTIAISTIGAFGKALKQLELKGKNSGNKFIPYVYKTASRKNRLAVLAGIIDTDGSLTCNGYDYISKSNQLAKDVQFVARSLGFAAYVKECKKKDQHGTEGTYYRVSITGNNLEDLPLLLNYKKATKRLQKKDPLVTGFKLKILPEDKYYGFELDKDHLYLTEDFIVHHNTGKSIVPAIFIKSVMDLWPTQRFLLLTHVKELIEQNAEVLRFVWPNCPLGIYSAGLKQKNYAQPVVYAGIQSAIKNPSLFGWRDIIFIDEAHLVNQDDASIYITFLATMKLINPHVKVIGMTATPFRMGQGLITDSGLFTDIVHNLCSMDNFNKLITDGYLSPLIPLRTKIELDVSNVSMQKGEFIQSQLQHAVDVADVTFEGLREVVEAGHDRKSWLLFASGIEHSEHIAQMMTQFGIDCAAVHSKQTSEFNDRAIRAFKANSLRSIVNYGKLTTGFNHPDIDLIAMFRPTMSVPLWIQMLGRGTRPVNGKNNCMVLDFARNTLRLGPVNDPIIPRRKGEGTGEVPIKICNACGVFNHIKAKTCIQCGNEFEFEIKLTKTSATTELIKSDLPIIEEYEVDRAIYVKHTKDGKPPCIKVTYFCGLLAFNEWVFPQTMGGLPRHRFHTWWKQRHTALPPTTVDETLQYITVLKVPKSINVWVNKRYPEITKVEF